MPEILTYFRTCFNDRLTDKDTPGFNLTKQGEFPLSVVAPPTLIRPSRFMASISAPYFRSCSSYLLIRANSSASGNLFLRFCRGGVAAKTHSRWALVQLAHGLFLSHLIFRLWHRIQGFLWVSERFAAAIDSVGLLLNILKAAAKSTRWPIKIIWSTLHRVSLERGDGAFFLTDLPTDQGWLQETEPTCRAKLTVTMKGVDSRSWWSLSYFIDLWNNRWSGSTSHVTVLIIREYLMCGEKVRYPSIIRLLRLGS